MTGSAEPAQLNPFAILDLLGIAVAPLDGNLAVGVGVDEDVERAVTI